MTKSKKYIKIKFSGNVIREVISEYNKLYSTEELKMGSNNINVGEERNSFDNLEEFLKEYNKNIDSAHIDLKNEKLSHYINIHFYNDSLEVEIMNINDRKNLDRLFKVFENRLIESKLKDDLIDESKNKFIKKSKTYFKVKFTEIIIRNVISELNKLNADYNFKMFKNSVYLNNEEYSFDNIEEFFSEYRKTCNTASLFFICEKRPQYYVDIYFKFNKSEIDIKLAKREYVERIFGIFENNFKESELIIENEEIDKPIIFIGHGKDNLWKELKDHLTDKHNYKIEAYEIGARAGHTIRDMLDSMLKKSSVAFLVMTGEDQTIDGKFNPRLNVVHEAGLFQGRLGFEKAIILLEEDTQEFSNIHGIEQIRFKKGNIKETFGEVLAVIKREFPNS